MLPLALPCPTTGARMDLRRGWPRSTEHALLEYVRPDGTTVAAQWFASRQRLAEVAARTPEPSVALPDRGVLVQPGGVDRRLVALRRSLRTRGARLVVHRPERRAVVALPDAYLKIVRPGRSDAVVAKARGARDHLGAAFALAEVLDHDHRHGVIRFARLPGRTLHDLGADPAVPDSALASAWHRLGVSSAAVATLGAAATDLPVRTPADEHANTLRWLRFASDYGLLPDGTGDDAAALDQLAALPERPLSLVHGDLHDKQVLVAGDGSDGSQLGLVDLDTLALGDPALDLANLLVHIQLRQAQGLLTPARATLAAAALRAGADVARRPGLAGRIDAYATAVLLRLRGVYAFRPAATPAGGVWSGSGAGRRPERRADHRTPLGTAGMPPVGA